MNLRIILTRTALCVMLAIPLSSNATLMGDSVQGALGSQFSNGVTTQFTSPAIVGADAEFSGVITDSSSQMWDIVVDIGASSFTVSINERIRNGDGNIKGGPNLMALSLSDLDWIGAPGMITDVALSSYNCASAGFSCTSFREGPDISVLNFGPTSLNFSADIMRNGEVYAFGITTHVPEPATIALLGLGLAGLGFTRWRRIYL